MQALDQGKRHVLLEQRDSGRGHLAELDKKRLLACERIDSQTAATLAQ
jgi:hypothetical protein